ncbi:MAG: YbaK/prolyl-tRNA synthetase associated region [Hyphomicrobiales bacterium]|nr:YbaK/prolyl-tRNA synthetase associated region [Hyphomicrobiales bacterium]
MTILTPAEQRVADALAQLGLPGKVIVLETLATTAVMAADALDVEVGRIVKSLIFKGAETGKPYMLLVSGANRVHEKRVGRQLGEALERADADFVKDVTGFSIGGVSPFGHPAPLSMVIDEAFLPFDTIWAAAGNPRSVFEITPADLERTTGATRMNVT